MNKGITIVEGGHYQKKGHWYRLCLLLPIVRYLEVISLHKKVQKERRISFDTSIRLTSNENYVNIRVTFIGFGFGFEIYIK